MSDLINRADAIEAIEEYMQNSCITDADIIYSDLQHEINILPSADAAQGWIPIKCHKITDKEREENEYLKDLVWFLDCEMPADGQKILVQTTWRNIDTDWCYIEDGFLLDSGRDWVADIVAWMPLPKPYER